MRKEILSTGEDGNAEIAIFKGWPATPNQPRFQFMSTSISTRSIERRELFWNFSFYNHTDL